ncbi:MAG TPA: acireductone synthase [Rhodanobacteraceae bacterium]|nr:acireductone synthase [Rhodanobacteraceae bacterium]
MSGSDMRTRAIVTDIEGTTSSISFVKDVLFPYARQHLPAFVRAHAAQPEVRRWLDQVARDAGVPPADTEAIIDTLLAWIDADRKATPLKALQGMIWQRGYEDGAYRAHLYPEVAAQLQAWHAAGIALYVYSSGSVAAQRLFFGYSEAGDLTPLVSGWFDTETGPKRAAASYAAIAAAIGEAPGRILFLSDSVDELRAAREAGLQVTQLCRPPEACPADSPWPCVASFDDIAF